MTAARHRAARAVAHLAEVDPALAVLALWCGHADDDTLETAARTETSTIRYGPAFDALGLPEQVGLVAHHVLHVALRHADRQAALADRLGDGFDPVLYGLAADAIINETLLLADHALPRPAVTLMELLDRIGAPAPSRTEALGAWDADRLAMFLMADDTRGRAARDMADRLGFARDLGTGQGGGGPDDGATQWRNRTLGAMEAGRRAGAGIGRLGAILADMAPARTPWEVVLRGLLARALTDRTVPTHRRPAHRWIAMSAAARTAGGPEPVFEPGRSRAALRPRIVVGLDTSSSIDPQTLRLFTAEARAITRRTGAEAHLLAFDDRVFLEKRLDPAGWQALGDPAMRRGGGTDYTDLFARAAALAPSIAVILTDLDAPVPPRPAMPLLWAVPGPAEPPPYGRFLEIGLM